MPLNLDYYYGGEAEQYNFYRIPKVLFTDAHYSQLSMEAKVLYGLMLDRMGLSVKNTWMDNQGRVYIFFTLEDVISMLNTGHNKAVKLFKELEDIGLIERKKQGQGKPTIIYVKNFILPSEPGHAPTPEPPSGPQPETSQNGKSALPMVGSQAVQTSENRKSKIPETGTQDFPKGERNNTEINHTEINDTDLSIPPLTPPPRRRSAKTDDRDRMEKMDVYREIIRENIEYDVLVHDNPHYADVIDGYVELMVDTVCGNSPTVRVSKQDMPTEVVRNRFLKIGREHIEYVMDCMKQNTTRIGNIKAYMLSALYNAPITIGQYFTSLVSHDMAQGCGAG